VKRRVGVFCVVDSGFVMVSLGVLECGLPFWTVHDHLTRTTTACLGTTVACNARNSLTVSSKYSDGICATRTSMPFKLWKGD